MLRGYYCFLEITGFKPRFAESNYVANQIRLQSMEYEEAELNIVMAGSSLTARLESQAIKGLGISLNLGLDGSNAVFAANAVIDSGKEPKVLLIELNTIYLDSTENDQTLTTGLQAGTHKLAEHFPLVRAESRPVTIIYSKIKSFKDSKLVINLNPEDYKYVRPKAQYFSVNGLEAYKPCPALESLIEKAIDNDIRVVLMMMPDGIEKPFRYGKLIEKMVKKYDIEVLDLKTPFADKLVYTDGLHLSEPAAKFLTNVVSNAFNE